MSEPFEPREVWRSIPSMPAYLASSLGRVMRTPHRAPVPNGGVRPYGGVPVVGSPDDTGRPTIKHAGKNYFVSRLICEAFHGAATPDKPVCMHLDEDHRNNRPGNLAWGTQKENLNAPGFIEYCKGRTGENNPRTKGFRKQDAA